MPDKNRNSTFHHVHRLRSPVELDRHYRGPTIDLGTRLKERHGGRCMRAVRFRPWQIATAIAFPSKDKAAAFEKYLKSHSGRAFARKQF